MRQGRDLCRAAKRRRCVLEMLSAERPSWFLLAGMMVEEQWYFKHIVKTGVHGALIDCVQSPGVVPPDLELFEAQPFESIHL